MERSRIVEGDNRFGLHLWSVVCPICGNRITSLETNSDNPFHFVKSIKTLGWYNSNDAGWVCPDCEREIDRGKSIDLALCKRFHPICVRLSDNLTAAYCVYDGHQPIIFEFEEIGGKKIGFGRCPKCGRIHWSMQEEDEE